MATSPHDLDQAGTSGTDEGQTRMAHVMKAKFGLSMAILALAQCSSGVRVVTFAPVGPLKSQL